MKKKQATQRVTIEASKKGPRFSIQLPTHPQRLEPVSKTKPTAHKKFSMNVPIRASEAPVKPQYPPRKSLTLTERGGIEFSSLVNEGLDLEKFEKESREFKSMLEEQSAVLEKTRESISEEKPEVEGIISKQKEIIKKLTEELSTAKKKLEEEVTPKVIRYLSEENTALKIDKGLLEENLTTLRNRVKSLQGKLKEVEAKVKNKNESIVEAIKDTGKLYQAKIELLEKKLESCNKPLQNAKNVMKLQDENIIKLNNKVKELEKQVDSSFISNEKLAKLQSEKEQLEQKLENQAKHISELEKGKAILNISNEFLTAKIKEKEDFIVSTQKKQSELQSKITLLEENAKKKAKPDESAKVIADLRAGLSEKEKELAKIHAEYKEKIEKMASALNEKQELRLIAMKNLESIKNEKTRMEAELGEVRTQLESYKKGMETKKKEISELQAYKNMYEEKALPKGTPKRMLKRKQRTEEKKKKQKEKPTPSKIPEEEDKDIQTEIFEEQVEEESKSPDIIEGEGTYNRFIFPESKQEVINEKMEKGETEGKWAAWIMAGIAVAVALYLALSKLFK